MSESTHKRLQGYIEQTYGSEHNVTSAIIQRALKEFLDREEHHGYLPTNSRGS